MPFYIYTDDNGHMQRERHSMAECDTVRIECDQCGATMRRRPLPVRVVWDGLPPHQAAQRPQWLTDFIEDTPRRREEEYYPYREAWRENKRKQEAAANG